MPLTFVSILQSISLGRAPGTQKRRTRAIQPHVDVLEGRIVLSSVVRDPSYGSLYYQPLNGDTQYSITGQIGTSYQLHQYAFYATSGSSVSISANLPNVAGYYDDSDIRGYSLSDGSSQFYSAFSQRGTASAHFHALTSGIYVFYFEVTFTDATGPLDYSISLSGTATPKIGVTSPSSSAADPNTFYISATPSMPKLNAVITGVVPDDLHGTTFHWATQIDYNGPKSATGKDLSATHSPLLKDDTIFSTKYSPVLANLGYYGGDLTMAVTATIDGVSVNATTEKAGMTVRGKNPTIGAIQTFVQSLATPGPVSKSSYNFSKIIQSIIKTESTPSETQFAASGYPLLNSGYDGGGGLMQVTYHRTDADYWDWQANIIDGYKLFKSGMNTAINYLTVSPSELATIAAQNGLSVKNLTVQAYTPDQLVVDSISEFGPNADVYYELNQDTKGNLLVTKTKDGKHGTIIVIQNPKYDHKYVNAVLSFYAAL
jgi:hypothetical protein